MWLFPKSNFLENTVKAKFGVRAGITCADNRKAGPFSGGWR
jgi:hypothetical protein